MSIVYLGLGSNKGNKFKYIADAIYELSKHRMNKLLGISGFYETEPYGDLPQDNFVNCCVKLQTRLDYESLFQKVKEMESVLGRTKSERWGPREIDIDILLFDDLVIETEIITIPHKGITERDFVIVPLLELEPNLKIPGKEIYLKDIEVEDKTIISKLKYSIDQFQEVLIEGD